MKTLYILATLLVGTLAVQAQEVRFHLDGGTNSPFGNFTELNPYASTGFSVNGGVSYFFSKKLGLGIDLGTFNNPIENGVTEYANSLPFETQLNGANNLWKTNYATIGPILRLGKNELTFEISPQIGYASYIVPAYSVTYFSEILQRDLIIQEQEPTENVTSLLSSLNVRVGYQISKNFNIYFKAGVQTNELFSDHNEQRLRYKNLTDRDGDGMFSDQEIITSPNLEDTFCSVISTLQTNIGVSYTIPLGNTQEIEGAETLEGLNTCQPTILKEPYDQETFFAASGTVPQFTWINHTDKRERSFVFELYQEDVLLFEKKIRSNSYTLSKRVTEDLYKIPTPKEYKWRVRTEYEQCEQHFTDYSVFMISPPQSGNREEGSCALEFIDVDINCDTPAFDNEGRRYTGTFTVKNNSDVPALIQPNQHFSTTQLFDVNTTLATLTYSQSSTFNNSPCVASALVLIPNYGAALPSQATATYCFELTVDLSVTSLKFISGIKTRPGTLDESDCNSSSDSVTLDNCICDTCEEWQYSSTDRHLLKSSWQNQPFNFQAVEELTIAGNDPIMEVKAEIISVQHVANDPLCYTCTKHENEMGLFSFKSLKPRVISTDAWLDKNGQIGVYTDANGNQQSIDRNSDDYVNQAIWRAYNPAVGIDFSNPQRFVMPINLPEPSSLDCCEHEYKVCIRYTFTDINCNTCSEDFCYTSNGKVPPVVIGNPSGTSINNNATTPLIRN